MGWIFSFRQFRPSIIYHVMLGWMVIHCTHAESVTLMTVPKMVPLPRWSWHWPVYGPSGPTIEQWTQDWPGGNQNQRIRYSVCDSSARTQPNQWLTSTDIPVGPANKVYITIEYAVADCSVINNQYCRHNISLYIHKSAIQLGSGSLPDPYTNIGIFDKIGTSSPKVVTTGTMNQVENTETFSAMVDATKPYVYLAFHYQGGCMRLFSVSVQYYLCPSISLSSNFVSLPQTIAPADNSTKVHGTCSSAQHVKPLTNESNLYGYCQENGEWSTDMYNGECGCDYGYGKFATVNSGAECRACPSGMYSNKVSNSNCTKCPLNSEQNSNRTSCDCKPTFYRTDQETKFDNCSGQPSAPQNLSITFVNASSVSVTWSPPSDSGGRTDLYYTAECNRCDDQGTECTRECPGADTTVNQNTRLVRINGLSAYTYYQLRVYAKNGISKLAETKKDMAKHDEVKMRTSETVPGIPVVTVKQLSPTSVFLSWEVEEKNGIITYYQVSYHPVGQPSEVKVFNTTATNATITGLRTGNEYQFKVRASSSIGLGRSASQTKKVGIQENNAKTDITVPVLGAIVGLLLLAFAVVVIVYFVRKRRADTSGQKQSVTFAPPSNDIKMIDETHFPEGFSNPPEPHGLGSPESRDDLYMVVADDTLWEVPRENISVIKRLGCGNFGYVDKALAIGLPGIPGQVIVAVKSLKVNVKEKDKEDFLTELNLMMRLAPHRHVVRLYGCCTKPDGPQSIILEYLPYGDLLGYLRRSRGHEDSYCSGDLRPESKLKSKDLLKFGWMIADGMSFLADNKCVHRDLAARNVLVGENKICKISDLGLARKVREDIYTRSSLARLPVKWMPPESIFFGQSTIASDVWSFGIVLWELFTLGDSPYPGFQGKDVTRLLREGYRMPRPAHLSQTLYALMLKCWKENPEDRPSFSTISEEINSYYMATQDYINLEVFDDGQYVNFDAM